MTDDPDAYWVAKNHRRIALIERKHGGGLNACETAELARLKREVYAHLQEVDPRPTDRLDAIDARIAELRRRVVARREAREMVRRLKGTQGAEMP